MKHGRVPSDKSVEKQINAVPANFVRLRKKAGMSQSEMAEQLGISQQMVGHIEKGRYRPSMEVMIKFAAMFAIEPTELMK